MDADPPKADLPKRKRRWFQFSLRTLLIGVTLLAVPCAYVGWQENIVRERWAMRKRIEEVDKGTVSVSVDSVIASLEGHKKVSAIPIPWIRRLLGDEPISEITLPIDTDREERRLIHNVIPEAGLGWYMPHVGGHSVMVIHFRDDD